MPDTRIITFASYKKLFTHIKKEGILIPVTSLDDDKTIDDLVSRIIENLIVYPNSV